MVAQKARILKGVCFTASDYLCPGGFSDIYRGKWFQEPRGKPTRVAIKVPRVRMREDREAVERVRKHALYESALCSQLHHPNLMPLFGVFFNPNEQGHPCLVMPYCEEGDLFRYVAQIRTRPRARVNILELICGPAAGLEYLHDFKPHPIIHGDIKAHNMLLDNGVVRIADFGTSKTLSIPLRTGSGSQITGSYRWMSPELYPDNNPGTTTASDVWAFGMMILEVFTGGYPYNHLKTYWEVAVEITKGQLPPQPPEINNVTWAILKSCFSADPMKRPRAETVSIALNVMLAVGRVTPEALDNFMDQMHPLRHEVSMSRNFPCSWPGCKAQFDTLKALRPHLVPHWYQWADGQV
ncbi:kinase-like protein [Macrolepiota fuliginosa MF-IS2]|uniref:Kinase-like protein n=1 Tax=Macrolepiota fuliginosa MF-IS2 TaxID=1400762 RepID=A0A9P5XF71_9AGAR|nr:kinase-like protein [Macrolepiota fuliginosa MF-IS2]